MPSHSTGYKLVIIHSISVLIGCYELVDSPGILDCKGAEPSRHDSNGEVVNGVDALPEEEGELVRIIVEDETHVIEDISVRLVDGNGGIIINVSHDNQMLAVNNTLVFLVLEQFVIFSLFIQKILQTTQNIRRLLRYLPQVPIIKLLGTYQGSKLFNLPVTVVADDNVEIVFVELVDSADRRGHH